MTQVPYIRRLAVLFAVVALVLQQAGPRVAAGRESMSTN